MRVGPAEIQISGLFLIRIMMRAILTFLGNDATVAVVWRFLWETWSGISINTAFLFYKPTPQCPRIKPNICNCYVRLARGENMVTLTKHHSYAQ